MAINLGAGIGPAVAGILAGISYKLLFVGDGLTSVAAGIVLYVFFHSKIRKTSAKQRVESTASAPLSDINYFWYIILCLCYAMIFLQIFSTLPLYYDQVHHLTKEQSGYLLALNGIIVFVFEMMLVFKLENAIHPRKVIMFGILLSGIGLIILNLFSSPIILVISMIILSFSEIFAMPFMMTVAVSRADSTNRGKYTGIYSTAWSTAFVLSPLIGTNIVDHFGFETLWYSMSAFSVLTLIGMWFIVKRIMPVGLRTEGRRRM
jgi:predicted MFS family arabinose efflux permease